MSWHFSQGLVAAFSQENSLGGYPFAPWSSIPSALDDCSSAKMKETFHHSPYGTMFVPSTDTHGAGLLTWFLGDFLAPTYPKQEKKPALKGKRAPSGGTWQESLAKYDPDLRSWRTRQLSLTEDLEQCSVTWPSRGFLLDGECWDRTTLAPPTPEPVAGSWPTPCHGSSRWGGTFQEVGGSQNKLRGTPTGKLYVNPDFWESLMGWPIGWTGTAPLETAKIQEWQQLHFLSFQSEVAA